MKIAIIILVLFFLGYIPLYYFANSELRKRIGSNFVIYVVLITFAGFILPNIETYMAAIALLFVATVRSTLDAVCRYILLAAIVPEIWMPVAAGGHFFAIINSADVVGVMAYLCGRAYRREKARFVWTTEDSLVLTVFLIVAIGGTGFVKIDDTIRAWISTSLLVVLPYLLFRSSLTKISDYRMLVACLGAASVILAVFAVYEARFGWSIFEGISSHLGVGGMTKNISLRGGMLRASATMLGPLALACFMTLGIFALACSRDFFRSAIGYYGCLGISMLGLLASQSRGSLVALFGSAIVLSLALRKWGVAVATAAVAIVAWPALLFVANFSPLVAGFLHVDKAASHTQYYDYRNLLLERGLQEAAHNPLTGMRMSDVMNALTDITQGEHIIDLVNVYLVFLLISGIVGLLPFMGLTLASGVRAATGFKRMNDPALLRLRGFCLAALSVVLLQFSFVSFIDRTPMGFVLVLCGIRLLVLERQAARIPAGAGVAAGQPSLAGDEWRSRGERALAATAFGRDRPLIARLPAETS